MRGCPEDVSGLKVLVVGLGVIGGGVGTVRYFARHGAHVRVTDLRPPDELAVAIESLRDVGVDYVLGEHRTEDVHWADVVVRNPAVVSSARPIRLARELGKPVDMEMSVFARRCPAPITAVSGTKGKTTTVTILGRLLEAGGAPVRVAGNMGVSALSVLDELTPNHQVVLEISCQQLEGSAATGWSPDVAVLTNVEDDHLDRYGSMAAYRKIKASLVAAQGPASWSILPGWDGELLDLCASSAARKALVRLPDRPLVPTPDVHAIVDVTDNGVRWTEAGRSTLLCGFDDFCLPGWHNRANLGFAAAAAYANGRMPQEMSTVIGTLRAVEHRGEPVASAGRIRFVNDSAATAPVATAATLRGFAGQRIVLICGGTTKGSDFTPMAAAIRDTAAHLVMLPGSGTVDLIAQLGRHPSAATVEATDMADAVRKAVAVARRVDASVVLLSPGCASFGLFRNEFDRGRQFTAAAREAAAAERQGEPH